MINYFRLRYLYANDQEIGIFVQEPYTLSSAKKCQTALPHQTFPIHTRIQIIKGC